MACLTFSKSCVNARSSPVAMTFSTCFFIHESNFAASAFVATTRVGIAFDRFGSEEGGVVPGNVRDRGQADGRSRIRGRHSHRDAQEWPQWKPCMRHVF